MNTRTTAKQKSTVITAKKGDSVVKTGADNAVLLRELPLELLTPEQNEAVTAANYHHPESRLVLELFLQTTYLWQLARRIQHNPESIASINWPAIERSTARIINQSLSKLLAGVNREPWNLGTPAPASPSKPARKSKPAVRQACGCSQKHSDAAGVVAACQLGKEQGRDESWTGH